MSSDLDCGQQLAGTACYIMLLQEMSAHDSIISDLTPSEPVLGLYFPYWWCILDEISESVMGIELEEPGTLIYSSPLNVSDYRSHG